MLHNRPKLLNKGKRYLIEYAALNKAIRKQETRRSSDALRKVHREDNRGKSRP